MSKEDKDKKIIRSAEQFKTYTIPELYDIAFDFRDVPAQVDFLLSVAQKHLGRKITSAMELACGPAYHVREIARRGLVSHGLDLEPAMADYSNQLIVNEKLSAKIIEGDMRYYRSEQKYDLVYLLMASFSQLLTNEDILDSFNTVAEMLNDGGIYIISTAHPRDFYGDEKSTTQTSWEMSRGDVTVKTCWGGEDEQFDPMTETDDIIVSFETTDRDGTTRYEFPDRLRRCSILTFDALLSASGRFEIVDRYGDLDENIKLSNDKKCWRFLPVLKKTS